MPISNTSLERKAFASSTTETMLEEDLNKGNNYDSDNNANDFILRSAPNPQNAFSENLQIDQIQTQENSEILFGNNNTESIKYLYQSFIPQKNKIIGLSLKTCYTANSISNKDFKINFCSGENFSANNYCVNATIGTFSLSTDQTFSSFSSCENGLQEIYFNFGSGFTVIPGQVYHFQLMNTNFNPPSFEPFKLSFQDSDVYTDGKMQFRNSDNSLGIATTSDLWFKIF